MRFCPFCSAENADEATHCASCARRLPALPRRRTEASQPSAPPEPEPEPEPIVKPRVPVRRATSTPPPQPHSRPATGAPRPSSLADIHLGPAAHRRAPVDEAPREAEAPARRKSDEDAPEETPVPAGDGRARPASIPPPTPADAPRALSPSELHRADSTAGRKDTTGRPDTTGVREPTLPEPPPTRVTSGEAITTFRRPQVEPIPDVPEGGLLNASRYAIQFVRARMQRRNAIKALETDIRTETASLDSVLGQLGKKVRDLGIDNRALSAENAAIDAAEARRKQSETESAELTNRQAEENGKFADVAADRETKEREAQEALDKAEREHGSLDAQRKGLRDKRKTIERQQKGYLKAADDREAQAGKAQIGDERMALRRAAEDLRRDAAGLDPERQDLERRLAALDRPLGQALAKVEALKQELESARRGLNDAREGHRHKLAEIEAEQGRKSRELAQAEAEVQRRLVTLGTLVNLHRIERPDLAQLYARVDQLRGAIGAQSTEIDRLTAEREAYDKASLVRGMVVIGGGVVAFITLVVILIAIF